MPYEQPSTIDIAKKFLQSTIDVCKESRLVITGTLFLEDGENPAVPLTLKAYPNGDWIAWVFKDEHFNLLALVNKRIKHVMTVHQSQTDELSKAIEEINKEIGK